MERCKPAEYYGEANRNRVLLFNQCLSLQADLDLALLYLAELRHLAERDAGAKEELLSLSESLAACARFFSSDAVMLSTRSRNLRLTQCSTCWVSAKPSKPSS